MRDELQQELAEAFNDDLADAMNNFTCSKVTYSGNYNPVTEQYDQEENTTYSGRCILGNYLKDTVKPDDYQVSDVKALLLQNEVTAVPQINDEWVMGSDTYKVINVSKDPVNATWSCQLRRA